MTSCEKGVFNIIYGYARVSTRGQATNGNSLEAQEEALKAHGAEKIFIDVITGAKLLRPQLDILVREAQKGDTVIVTKLDRIARSITQGITIIETFLNQGISINVLNMGILDNSAAGKLIRNVMLCFAEFEREMIRERMQDGKEIAKRRPDYHEGRPYKFTKVQKDFAVGLLNSYSVKQVVAMTGISASTLMRHKRSKSSESETN